MEKENRESSMIMERDKIIKNGDKLIKKRDKGSEAGERLVNIREFVQEGKEKIRVFKKQRRQKRFENGEVELPVFRVGPNKKGVTALWILMGASLAFGVYKNFTAIDKETIRETTVVEAEVIDTNAVESFVTRFAYLYHAWDNDYQAKSERETTLSNYMTEELIKVNSGAVNSDCPTKSEVENVRICEVEDLEDGNFKVRYSIMQQFIESSDVEEIAASVSQNSVPVVSTGETSMKEDITGQKEETVSEETQFQGTQTGETAEDIKTDDASAGTNEETVDVPPVSTGQTGISSVEVVQDENGTTIKTKREAFYLVQVHVDESGSMVIMKNPTACGVPGKSAYAPKMYQNDGSVDVAMMSDIEDFLSTFFSLYPMATEKELIYYVKAGTMDVINEDFVFDALQNAAYYMEDGQIKVHVYVRYLDQTAKVTQISEYTLTLEKGDNWKIIEAE